MAKQTRSPMVTDRQKQVGVRLSEREYNAIKQRADAAGLRVSQYLRLLGLKDANFTPDTKSDGS